MLMSFFPRYKQANLLLAAHGRAQAAAHQQEGWADVVCRGGVMYRTNEAGSD